MIDAADVSPTALEFARQRAARAGVPAVAAGAGVGVRFLTLDALHDALPDGYDVITSSLFLHHLAGEDAATLLAKMAAARPRLIVVNDLLRDWLGYALAFLGPRVLTRCRVLIDSPKSRCNSFPQSRGNWASNRDWGNCWKFKNRGLS